jgi:potassium-transporting ATPase potassium-binding subunit
LQSFLPWFFPKYLTTPLSPDLALNTAISFSTTTTWQAYGGENTMSYFSQMAGLCAQNFLAGAAGLAIGIAFIRGFARQLSKTLGNFWVDTTPHCFGFFCQARCSGGFFSSGREFQ